MEWSENLKTYNAKSKEFQKRQDRLLNDIFNRDEEITHRSASGFDLLCKIDFIGAIHDDIFKAEQELRKKLQRGLIEFFILFADLLLLKQQLKLQLHIIEQKEIQKGLDLLEEKEGITA